MAEMMSTQRFSWVHYQSENGERPFDTFLSDLNDPDRVEKIKTQMAYVLAVGVVRAAQKRKVDQLRDDIWEVRVAYKNNIYRVLYARLGSTLVALHGFQKKTQKTPEDLIELAEKRFADWRARSPPLPAPSDRQLPNRRAP